MKTTKNILQKQELHYSETLLDLGFGIDEVNIYEYLLKNNGKMASGFNLATGKPNMRFFEGKEGI